MMRKRFFISLVLLAFSLLVLPSHAQADCNGNGVADATDIAEGTSQDCNENGVPDECDIAEGTSLDLNSNGIPDECICLIADADCSGAVGGGDIAKVMNSGNWLKLCPEAFDPRADVNQDGMVNDLDKDTITAPGTWGTGNGYHCECEVPTCQTIIDCNYNNIPDSWDIDQGTSADCNNNSIPDECDIAGGISNDCDLNGIPDQCQFDCDGDGIADACEILSGNESDCNANNIPDSCDLAGGYNVSQWANSVIGYSSQANWGGTMGHAVQATGVPDVTAYGLNPMAWTPYSSTASEYITLGYADSVYATGVSIVETCGNGFVTQVDLVDEDDQLHTVWTGTDTTDCSSNFANCSIDTLNLTWASTSYLVKGVKITIDATHHTVDYSDDHEQIDAVQLHGTPALHPDCNDNGIPDECDISSGGSSTDANGDGIPDECGCRNEDVNCDGYVDVGDVLIYNAPSNKNHMCADAGNPRTDVNRDGMVNDFDLDAIRDPAVFNTGNTFGCGCDVPVCAVTPDCNTNGIPDSWDIHQGTSLDCNNNSIPDECDISSNTSTDCDSNGVPDDCQWDCDGDGIYDPCEIAMGMDIDCDNNGFPDSCDVAGGFAFIQWADSVAEYSSQYDDGSTDSWHATQALGKPDVREHGDNELAWATLNADDGAEYIILNYTHPVFATGATVVESMAPGFVTQIDAVDLDDQLHTVWSGSDTANCTLPLPQCEIGELVVNWTKTAYVVKGLKVTIDTTHMTDVWEEIDAVALHGELPPQTDCNGNGICDKCELDCNENGIPDECDMAAGTSADIDSNGIPDECYDAETLAAYLNDEYLCEDPYDAMTFANHNVVYCGCGTGDYWLDYPIDGYRCTTTVYPYIDPPVVYDPGAPPHHGAWHPVYICIIQGWYFCYYGGGPFHADRKECCPVGSPCSEVDGCCRAPETDCGGRCCNMLYSDCLCRYDGVLGDCWEGTDKAISGVCLPKDRDDGLYCNGLQYWGPDVTSSGLWTVMKTHYDCPADMICREYNPLDASSPGGRKHVFCGECEKDSDCLGYYQQGGQPEGCASPRCKEVAGHYAGAGYADGGYYVHETACVYDETSPGCDDGNDCTIDLCVPLDNDGSGSGFTCIFESNCDDGEFCNGIEECGEDGNCIPGENPCAGQEGRENCDEFYDVCHGCDEDNRDPYFCNGVEYCRYDPNTGTWSWVSPGPPCGDWEECSEEERRCISCAERCSDGLVCTGIEECDENGLCVPATPVDLCAGTGLCCVEAPETEEGYVCTDFWPNPRTPSEDSIIPVDGATDIPLRGLTLSWDRIPEAEFYSICIFKDGSNSAAVTPLQVDNPDSGDTVSAQISINDELEPGQLYNWSITVVDNERDCAEGVYGPEDWRSSSTESRGFTTTTMADNCLLGIPRSLHVTLANPENPGVPSNKEAGVGYPLGNFKWEGDSKAQVYHLFLSENEHDFNGDGLRPNDHLNHGLHKGEFEETEINDLEITLQPGTTYYWQVAAKSQYCKGDDDGIDTLSVVSYSEVFKFYTSSDPNDNNCPDSIAKPETPIDPRPKINSNDASSEDLALSWSRSENASSYTLTISGFSGYDHDHVEVDVKQTPDGERPAYTIPSAYVQPLTTYNWSVLAVNENKDCELYDEAQSSDWQFTTCAAEYSEFPSVDDPEDGATDVSLTSGLTWISDDDYAYFNLYAGKFNCGLSTVSLEGLTAIDSGDGTYPEILKLDEVTVAGTSKYVWPNPEFPPVNMNRKIWDKNENYEWRVEAYYYDECGGIVSEPAASEVWRFATIDDCGGFPTSPSLASNPEPIDNAVDVPVTGQSVTLGWKPHGEYARIQIGLEDDPATMVWLEPSDSEISCDYPGWFSTAGLAWKEISVSSSIFPIDTNTKYYWRVETRNACGDEIRDAVPVDSWEFTTADVCTDPGKVPTPRNVYPYNGAQGLSAGTQWLRWKTTNNSYGFDRFEVYLGTSEHNLAHVKTIKSSSPTGWTVPVTLEPATKYYWKVKACAKGCYHQDLTPASGVTTWFSTCDSVQSEVFTGQYPADGEQGVVIQKPGDGGAVENLPLILRWTHPEGVETDGYRISFGKARESMTTLGYQWVSCEDGECSWELPAGIALELGTEYAWQVKAFVYDSCGNVSGVFGDRWTFQTMFDCNNNGLSDLWDVINGYSIDEDSNRVPDECNLCDLNRVFTTDDDFADGDKAEFLNVIQDSNKLTLATSAGGVKPLPFIWVPATNRGTVVKINTETGEILGEYLTAPEYADMDPNRVEPSPSRTAVDLLGNVWVSNNGDWNNSLDASSIEETSSVTRVALNEGGYCTDRNDDEFIDTSSGLGDILGWPNNPDGDPPYPDDKGGVSTAVDECIIDYVRACGRNFGEDCIASLHSVETLAIDSNNDIWIGSAAGCPGCSSAGCAGGPHMKLKGDLGMNPEDRVLTWSTYYGTRGGGGGLIDADGLLWSGGESCGIQCDPAGNPELCGEGYGMTDHCYQSLLVFEPDAYSFFEPGSGTPLFLESDYNECHVSTGIPDDSVAVIVRSLAMNPVDGTVWATPWNGDFLYEFEVSRDESATTPNKTRIAVYKRDLVKPANVNKAVDSGVLTIDTNETFWIIARNTLDHEGYSENAYSVVRYRKNSDDSNMEEEARIPLKYAKANTDDVTSDDCISNCSLHCSDSYPNECSSYCVCCEDPTGISIDANGNVWITCEESNNVMRVNSSSNEVDMVISLQHDDDLCADNPDASCCLLADRYCEENPDFECCNLADDHCEKYHNDPCCLMYDRSSYCALNPDYACCNVTCHESQEDELDEVCCRTFDGLYKAAHPESPCFKDAGPSGFNNMTGMITLAAAKTGHWSTVHDSRIVGNQWGGISWNQEAESCTADESTGLVVYIRVADTMAELRNLPFTEVSDLEDDSNDCIVEFSAGQFTGRFIEIEVTFDADGNFPELWDLTITTSDATIGAGNVELQSVFVFANAEEVGEYGSFEACLNMMDGEPITASVCAMAGTWRKGPPNVLDWECANQLAKTKEYMDRHGYSGTLVLDRLDEYVVGAFYGHGPSGRDAVEGFGIRNTVESIQYDACSQANSNVIALAQNGFDPGECDATLDIGFASSDCGEDKDCDDGYPCTTDTCCLEIDGSCGTYQTCVYEPTDCNDDDLCTTDSCDPFSGGCVNEEVVCDQDPNLCTTESCDPETGECVSIDNCDSTICERQECEPSIGVCGEWVPTTHCDHEKNKWCNGEFEGCFEADCLTGVRLSGGDCATCGFSGDPCVGEGLVCDEDNKRCVDCTDDSHCTEDGYVCDVEKGVCVDEHAACVSGNWDYAIGDCRKRSLFLEIDDGNIFCSPGSPNTGSPDTCFIDCSQNLTFNISLMVENSTASAIEIKSLVAFLEITSSYNAGDGQEFTVNSIQWGDLVANGDDLLWCGGSSCTNTDWYDLLYNDTADYDDLFNPDPPGTAYAPIVVNDPSSALLMGTIQYEGSTPITVPAGTSEPVSGRLAIVNMTAPAVATVYTLKIADDRFRRPTASISTGDPTGTNQATLLYSDDSQLVIYVEGCN